MRSCGSDRKKMHHKQHGLRITSGRRRLYTELAEIDRGHHHECLYWVEREQEKAKEIRRRFTRKYANGNSNLATCCPRVEVMTISKSGAGSHSPKINYQGDCH
jgi:hypothetical protein